MKHVFGSAFAAAKLTAILAVILAPMFAALTASPAHAALKTCHNPLPEFQFYFGQCVRDDFGTIEKDLKKHGYKMSLPVCHNPDFKDLTAAFSYCVRSNFQKLQVFLSVPLKDCVGIAPRVHPGWVLCLQSNFKAVDERLTKLHR